MKKLFCVLVLAMFVLTGCFGYKIVKKQPEPETSGDVLTDVMNKKNSDELYKLLGELLQDGKIEKRETTSKRFLSGDVLTYEKWLIVDEGGNLHVAVIENRILSEVEPINEVKDWDNYKPFWKKFEPRGGWQK